MDRRTFWLVIKADMSSDFEDRDCMTEEEARTFIRDTESPMILHLLKNEDGSYSVMGHVVCEYCDYCVAQGDCRGKYDAKPQVAKEDPYTNQRVEKSFLDNIDVMIQEPLVTEDGFVNEACINELAAAFNNAPKTYERLKNDPEWSTKRVIVKDDITSGLAKYAIHQSPYACPDNLEIVIRYLDACLDRAVDWDGPYDCPTAYLSLCDINKLLYEILYDDKFSYFVDWNVPRKNVPQNERPDVGDKNPDHDFIDLDALLHNVCLDIRADRREFDRFNNKFDEEQQKIEIKERPDKA